MVSEVRQQSARSSTRTSGALDTSIVQEFRCSICLLHGKEPIFLVFSITRKIIFPSTFDIYFEAPLSAVPGEEVGEGVVDREGLTVALQPHHAAARVAASRGQGEVEDSNDECFYSPS